MYHYNLRKLLIYSILNHELEKGDVRLLQRLDFGQWLPYVSELSLMDCRTRSFKG